MPRIFVCEYITGGGLAGKELPVALAAAGDAMLQALLDDLRALPTVKTATTRDARLASLDPDIETQVILPTGSVWERWEQCIEAADAVWPIAPETGGVLERLSRCVLDKNRILIGCHPQAVHVTASKFRTARDLKRHHIPVADTTYLNTELPSRLHRARGNAERAYGACPRRLMRPGRRQCLYQKPMGQTKCSDRFAQGRPYIGIGEKRSGPIGVCGA